MIIFYRCTVNYGIYMWFIHQQLHFFLNLEMFNFTLEYTSAQQTAHTPFHNMLPHLHTLYNNIIILNVLTELYL